MLPMEQENKKQPVYPPTPTLTLLLVKKNQSILNASLEALNNSSGAPETMNLPRNSLNI